MAQSEPKPKGAPKTKRTSLLRVLRPALLFLVPIALLIVALYVPETAAWWLRLSAYVLFGAIGLWLLIRLGFYLRDLARLRRQSRLKRREDPLFVAQTKMRERIAEVRSHFENSGKSIYDLPFYLVLGGNTRESEAFLSSCGVTFPSTVDDLEPSTQGDFERWRVANEAVFADVSRALRPHVESGYWEAFLSALAQERPRAPINGAIVILSLEHLAEGDSERRAERERLLQQRLQKMQAILELSFPVYVVVTGVDRLTGFNDYFAFLNAEQRKQLFGWSNPSTDGQEVDLGDLSGSFEKIIRRMKGLALKRMGRQPDILSVDRTYYFAAEFEAMLHSVERSLDVVFTPNNFIEPIALRGCYFVGGLEDAPAVSFAIPGPLGECKPAIDDSDLTQQAGAGHPWFCRDFVYEKLLPESAGIRRPGWVVRQQLRRKVITGVLAGLLGSLGIAWCLIGGDEGLTWARRAAPALEDVGLLLDDAPGASHPLDVLDRIDVVRTALDQQGGVRDVLTLGRYESLESDIATLHRAVFQEEYLRAVIQKHEQEIGAWNGQGRFEVFGRGLVTYISWANPYRDDVEGLDLEPMLEHSEHDERDRLRALGHFEKFVEEGGPYGQVVSIGAATLIRGALLRTNLFLNPDPGARGEDDSGEAGERSVLESVWWLRLVDGLIDISEGYNSLIAIRAPAEDTTYEELGESIVVISAHLDAFSQKVEVVNELLRDGEEMRIGWIAVDELFDAMADASKGWTPIEDAVKTSRETAGIYRERVVEPMLDRIHLVRLFFNQPGNPWLEQVLHASLEKDQQLKLDRSHSVGSRVFDLLERLAVYYKGIGGICEGQEDWASTLTADVDEIKRVMAEVRGRVRDVDDEARGLREVLGALGKLADEARPDGAAGEEPPAEGAAEKAKEKVAGLFGDESSTRQKMLRDLLDRYNWQELEPWAKGWIAAFAREADYQTAIAWEEAFGMFTSMDEEQDLRAWKRLRRSRPFAQNEGVAYVEPVERFFTEWLMNMPLGLKQRLEGDGPLAPELESFAELDALAKRFRNDYLPMLRKASKAFVGCVHAMDDKALASWPQLFESPGPGEENDGSKVSWVALQAFSSFQEQFETEEGAVFTDITEPLVGVENIVIAAYENQLSREFGSRWEEIVDEADQRGISQQFPYNDTLDDANYENVSRFVDDLQRLSETFMITPPEEAEKGDVSEASHAVLRRVAGAQRRRFLERNVEFKKFVRGNQETGPPEITAKVIPGEIGRHYHWIRIQLGNGKHYDMNVYGDRVVEIPIRPGSGYVSIQGLSVDKTMINEIIVGEGDLTLLGMAYLYGRNPDGKRRVWHVRSELAGVQNDGSQVPFDIVFDFGQPLPETPGWSG